MCTIRHRLFITGSNKAYVSTLSADMVQQLVVRSLYTFRPPLLRRVAICDGYQKLLLHKQL